VQRLEQEVERPLTRLLNSLRETQGEDHERLVSLEVETRAGFASVNAGFANVNAEFASVNAGLAQIVTLLSGPGSR
jgi:hypothetical protein